MKIGTLDITNCKIGGVQISEVRIGADLVWSSAPAYDVDALAFFTAAGITDTTQKSAVNQLVLDLKAASIWTKIQEILPFVGGNATSHRYDLKTATALCTFFGGVTHNSNGITFNGTTGYANSGWSVTAGNLYNRHYSQCVKSMISVPAWSGKFDGSNVFGMQLSLDSNLIQVGCNNLAVLFSQAITTNKLTVVQVESTTVGKVYNNGSLVHTTPAAINASPTSGSMFLGALNMAGGTPSFFQPSNLTFASYGEALTASEHIDFENAVDTFNTTLGR